MLPKIKSCYLGFYENGIQRKFLLKTSKRYNVIGRKASIVNPKVTVVLDMEDSEISRVHCQIETLLDTTIGTFVFLLKDLGSQNGTIIFNQQRQSMKLEGADVVFIENGYSLLLGQTEFEFKVQFAEKPTILKV